MSSLSRQLALGGPVSFEAGSTGGRQAEMLTQPSREFLGICLSSPHAYEDFNRQQVP